MLLNFSRRRRTGVLALFVVSAMAVSLSACGTSGRTLQEPKPGATAPARKNAGATVPANASPTTSAGAQISSTSFTLKATAWSTGQTIPKPYTCDGVNTSPPFAISGVPTGSVELVFVATNQNFANQTLWLMAGIAPATVAIPQGGVPSGAIQIINSSGSARWSGPCPVSGTNVYEFAIYALKSPSGLTTSANFADVNAAIATATAASVITGSYSR